MVLQPLRAVNGGTDPYMTCRATVTETIVQSPPAEATPVPGEWQRQLTCGFVLHRVSCTVAQRSTAP
jgi:hypothetical protein